MSFSTSKPSVGEFLPLTRPNGSRVKVPPSVVMAKNSNHPSPPASQLNAKDEKVQLKAVSRRQMVSFAAISLASVSLLLAAPAEARTTRADIKSKILEKLKELRERLGFPEQKDEPGEQTSSSEKDKEIEEKTSKNDVGEEKSTPQPENVGEENREKKSLPTPEVGEKSNPQPENEGGEKKSTPTPTPPPVDEGGVKSQKLESEGGETTSPNEKKDENPLLPFMNLNKVEVEALVEATLSQ